MKERIALITIIGIGVLIALVVARNHRTGETKSQGPSGGRDIDFARWSEESESERPRHPAKGKGKEQKTFLEIIAEMGGEWKPVDTPLENLTWVEPSKKHEEVIAKVEAKFDKMRGSSGGSMITDERPIRTKEEAKSRFLESRINNLPQYEPKAGFESADYYILTFMSLDYLRKRDYYFKTKPIEEHPMFDFADGGYAVRKSDGKVTRYKPLQE